MPELPEVENTRQYLRRAGLPGRRLDAPQIGWRNALRRPPSVGEFARGHRRPPGAGCPPPRQIPDCPPGRRPASGTAPRHDRQPADPPVSAGTAANDPPHLPPGRRPATPLYGSPQIRPPLAPGRPGRRHRPNGPRTPVRRLYSRSPGIHPVPPQSPHQGPAPGTIPGSRLGQPFMRTNPCSSPGIHPERAGASVAADPPAIAQLHDAIVAVLNRAVSRLRRRPRRPLARPAVALSPWDIPRRKDAPLPTCAAVVQLLKVRNRSTWYCPKCQPHADTPAGSSVSNRTGLTSDTINPSFRHRQPVIPAQAGISPSPDTGHRPTRQARIRMRPLATRKMPYAAGRRSSILRYCRLCPPRRSSASRNTKSTRS